MWGEDTWEGMGFAEVRFVDWMGVSLDERQHLAVVEHIGHAVVFDEAESVQIMHMDDSVIVVEEE